MKAENLYVAATNQHVGKTTSTLGLVSFLKQSGIDVGYCKPVGQKFLDLGHLKVDKDTLLFADLLGFDIEANIHSPVILGGGATSAFLDDPSKFRYTEDILHAKSELDMRHDYVVYEGTGHPGVGSIVGLSNAEVAKQLNAAVIMVVDGGIGSTIDRLNMSMALFREKHVPIIGVILNKIRIEKLDKIKHYTGMALEKMGLSLLGALPYDPSLGYPIMRTIHEAVKGSVVQNMDRLDNKIEEIMAGSLIDASKLKKTKNILLVVGVDRVMSAVHKIDLLSQVHSLEQTPIAGIVATGSGEIKEEVMEYVETHKIPMIRTSLDTYGSVLKISQIEVKINRQTPWKVQRAIELIRENVQVEKIIDSLKIK